MVNSCQCRGSPLRVTIVLRTPPSDHCSNYPEETIGGRRRSIRPELEGGYQAKDIHQFLAHRGLSTLLFWNSRQPMPWFFASLMVDYLKSGDLSFAMLLINTSLWNSNIYWSVIFMTLIIFVLKMCWSYHPLGIERLIDVPFSWAWSLWFWKWE